MKKLEHIAPSKQLLAKISHGRKRRNCRKLTVVGLVVLFASACSNNSGTESSATLHTQPSQAQQVQSLPSDSGMLRAAQSEAELFTAVVESNTEAATDPILVSSNTELENIPVAASNDALFNSVSDRSVASVVTNSSGQFTTTYTLEAGIDELDKIKYNGAYLFIASNPVTPCCLSDASPSSTQNPETFANALAAALSLAPEFPPTPQSSTIRVLATDAEEATANEVTTITLEKTGQAKGLYIYGDQLVAINSSNYYGSFGHRFIDPYAWHKQHIDLHFIDIANIENQESDQWNKKRLRIEGGYVQSKRIDNTLYIVTRHTPYSPYDYPILLDRRIDTADFPLVDPALVPIEFNTATTASSAPISANDETAELIPEPIEPEPSKLIPTVDFDGEQYDLFSYDDCYIKNEDQDKIGKGGSAIITSIVAIPLDDPAAFSTACYNQSTSGVYVSQNALYLFEPRYGDQPETLVHKFRLFENTPMYRGSGVVPGYVWHSSQRDFRVNEHNDQLRLMTTVFTGDSSDREDHILTILEESTSKLALNKLASLPNTEQPGEIGKDNESLYGVRFFGERAYAVTFERIDPLYVIDLSDPTAPSIAGELEVPGVAEFLHPVNENLLLTLGRAGQFSSPLKLELFDVSDLSAPMSIDTEILHTAEGDPISYSSAIYDRHAFTYLNTTSDTDRLSIPVSYTVQQPTEVTESFLPYWSTTRELRLFEIRDKDMPLLSSIQAVGKMTATDSNNLGYVDIERSFIHNDAVFYVAGQNVWSALWDTPSIQSGPH